MLTTVRHVGYQALTNDATRVAISIPPFDRGATCPLTDQTFSQRIQQAAIYVVAAIKLVNRNDTIYCDAIALYTHFIAEKKFEFPARGNIPTSPCEKVSFCALHSIEGRTSSQRQADAELDAMPTRNSFINTLLLACSHQDDEYVRRARLEVIVHYVTNKNYNKAWDWSNIMAATYPLNALIRQFVPKVERAISKDKQTISMAMDRHIGFLRNRLRCKKIMDIAKTILPLAGGACLMLAIPENYKIIERTLLAAFTAINSSYTSSRELTRTRKVILTAALGASLFDVKDYIVHGLQASVDDIAQGIATSVSIIASTASFIYNRFKYRNILRYIVSEQTEVTEVDIV